MFGGVFHDFLEQPWEQARGFLREELEQLQNVLASQWSKSFNTEGTMNGEAFEGDFSPSTAGRVYISNEGPRGRPRWAKVDANAGVKNRLRFVNFVQATLPSVLLGRRSASSGDFEQISLGDGLEMSGTELNATGARYSRTFLFMGS